MSIQAGPPRRASVSAQGPACRALNALKNYSVRRLHDSIECDCYRGAAMRLNTMVLAAIRCAAVLSIVLFLAYREAVAEDLDSASARMPGCRNQLNKKSARDLLDAYTQGICAGAVKALLFTSSCPPQNVTNYQAMSVVIRYIESQPARQHESFFALTIEALRQAWPCPK